MPNILPGDLAALEPSQVSFNHNFRGSYSFQPTTFPGFSHIRSFTGISDSGEPSNDEGNSKLDFRPSSRTCPLISKFHFPTIFDYQKQWRKQGDIQFKIFKPLHRAETLLSFQSPPNAILLTAKGLDGETGFKKRLLPSAHKGISQTLFTDQLQRPVTTNDLPAIRSGCSSKDVCVSNKLDCRKASSAGYAPDNLFRRLSASKSITRPVTDRGKIRCKISDGSRMVHQFRKVCKHSDEDNRFPRHRMEHTFQHQVSSAGQDTESSAVLTKHSGSWQLDPQAGATPLRVSKLCNFRHPPGKVALPNIATSQQSPTKKSPSCSAFLERCPCRITVVARQHSKENSNSSEETRNKIFDNRCIRCSMGSLGKRQEITRCLEQSAEKMALQLEGNVCSHSRDISGIGESQRLQCDPSKRQLDCGGLYSKRRRNEIAAVAPSYKTVVCIGGHSRDITPTTPLAGCIQYGCRSSLAQSCGLRMAPASRSDRKNLSAMGYTGSRSVRFKERACCSKVCNARFIRWERLLSRCLQQTMALQPGLGVSTTEPSTSCAPTSKLGTGSLYNHCTQVEEAVLGSRPEKSCSTAPSQDKGSELDVSGNNDRTSPTASTGPEVGSLAYFGWDEITEGWSAEEKSLLLSCWRKSTLKTYTPVWRKWISWCQLNGINQHLPTPAQVARYLGKLHISDKLSYRTILVHKSVIASICETISSVKISCSPVVRHLLKAISVARPLTQKIPVWDARVLISYLKNKIPNTQSLFEVSQRTAAILLLASGRRVHDLTLLHCDSEHFEDKEDIIILHPAFGSKTDSSTHHQSDWILCNSPDQNLNPVFWLRILKLISQDVRGCLTNLFITTRSPTKPASSAIIGGWVKRLLGDAGIQASPGSLRSAVSSLNWIEKYPINDILAKANWQHEVTFRKFYHRELQSNNTVSSEQSLSKFFAVSE